ncbi:MAG TPA: hypothetical protein VF618_16770 [Thermoanaerobaculia bacterium]
MRRLLIAISLLLIPAAAFAFDTSRGRENRVGILLPADFDGDRYVHDSVRKYLHGELRNAGFVPVNMRDTIDELRERGDGDAMYYVEITAGESSAEHYAGIGVAGRHGGVDLGVVASKMWVELNIYDGETLELIETYDLAERSSTIAPTGVSLGGPRAWGWVSLPWAQWAQSRRAAKAVARDVAQRIASID